MAVATMRGVRRPLDLYVALSKRPGLAANPRTWHPSFPAATSRGTREGARYGQKQAPAYRADPRMAALGAVLRVARAGALRADPTPGAFRHLRGTAGCAGWHVGRHALPEARPLRGGRNAEPLRRPGRQAQEAAPRRQAPRRGPEGRVP